LPLKEAKGVIPYHYHNKREFVITVISSEGIEILDGRLMPIDAGDVFLFPGGVKHATINKSGNDLQFLEYYNTPPGGTKFWKQ